MDGRPPLACGILSSSSDIEGCRAVVNGGTIFCAKMNMNFKMSLPLISKVP